MVFDGAWYAPYAHLTNFDTPLSGVDMYDDVIGLIGFFWIKIIKFCNLHLHGRVSMIH